MATLKDRMARRALVGVRLEIERLIETVAELRSDFPALTSLATTQAALVASMQELDGITGFDDRMRPLGDAGALDGAEAQKPSKAKPKPKLGDALRDPAKRSKPTAKSRPRPTAKPPARPPAKNPGKTYSWTTGRPVLEELAKAPNGLTVKQIATHFNLEYGAARWRLEVRRQKGHATITDKATSTYEITPEGRAALAKNEDNDIPGDIGARRR